MFVLAHVSDPHLPALSSMRLRDLASKRALGYANWVRKRQHIHRIETLDALVRDLKSQAPDHVAVTGDLVNLALESEFTQARTWLAALGTPQDVTLVPGNHDAYVRSTMTAHASQWRDYMLSDGANGVGFPFVRCRGLVALIGLSSAVPTGPFMATGRLGVDQIQRLAPVLAQLRDQGAFRVVLIHHPPRSAHANRLKRLTDAAALRTVLAEEGAELVIHGHDHVHELHWLDGPHGRIPAVGVPSASAAPSEDGRHERAAYNLYRIEGTPGAFKCEAISRGFRPGAGQIIELGRQELVPRPGQLRSMSR
jgi:3',5'-cyclic AMP phosphodiesterase CpdA